VSGSFLRRQRYRTHRLFDHSGGGRRDTTRASETFLPTLQIAFANRSRRLDLLGVVSAALVVAFLFDDTDLALWLLIVGGVTVRVDSRKYRDEGGQRKYRACNDNNASEGR
jgi:hypothetical protein